MLSPTRPGLKAAHLTTVWASKFAALQRCILREAASVGQQEPLLPQSPRSFVGTAVHKLFERAAVDPSFSLEEADLASDWDEEIGLINAFLSSSYYMQGMLPLSRSIPNLGLIRARTILRLKEGGKPTPLPKTKLTPGRTKTFPGRLSNKNDTVVGIPDQITRAASGAIISDYKTGITADYHGSFWDDYEIQLKLYAALFHISTDHWPVELQLHGLDGSIHKIDFSADECTKLMFKAETLASLLQTVTLNLSTSVGSQVAASTPSQQTCRFCAFRPGCVSYLRHCFQDHPLSECDLAGSLQGWKRFGNGELLIELKTRSDVVRIRNVPSVPHITDALNSSKPNQNIIVFNVASFDKQPTLFSPTAYTAIHIYDDFNE